MCSLKKILALALILSSGWALTACSDSNAAPNQEETIVEEGYNPQTGEIMLDDADFKDTDRGSADLGRMTDEGVRVLADESRVETLVDGFGNRSETRYFRNHPRIRFVLVRTGSDNTKTVTVYGYGKTRNADELGEIALTASADELADKAKLQNKKGINNPKPENFMHRTQESSFTPMPSSNYRVNQSPDLRSNND